MTIPVIPAHTLSKSDFKLARTCATKLYYREMRYSDNSGNDPYLRMLQAGGYMVEMLAKLEHPEGVTLEYGHDQAAAAAKTLELLAEENVTLFEATLLKDACLARVDILRKRGNSFNLYEVKAGQLDEEDATKRLEKTGSPFRSLTGRDKLTGKYPIAADWREYLEDVTYQVLLLSRLFPAATIRPHLTLVRKEFRAPVDQLPSWFEITEHEGSDGKTRIRGARFIGDAKALEGHPMTVTIDVADEVAELLPEVETATAQFVASLVPQLTKLTPELGMWCRECDYNTDPADGPSGWRECWGNRANVRPHILELHKGSKLVTAMVSEGITSLLDVPLERLRNQSGELGVVGQRQLIQIEHSKSDTEWIDSAMGTALAGAVYPLHFIDFEVATMAVPHHKGMAPYGRLAFQWSCHTVQNPGAQLKHTEWINGDELWPNAEFARTLRDAIGEEGTVLTWSPFEEGVLRSVANELVEFGVDDPELGAWLSRVAGTRESPSPRVLDLHKLCAKCYFHPGMKGRTGIKYVLDALWATSRQMRSRFAEVEGREGDPERGPYAALPPVVINGFAQQVAEGTGAIRAYEAMMYGVERTDEVSKASWRNLLRQYCRLDTLAMVLIWEHWQAATLGRNSG